MQLTIVRETLPAGTSGKLFMNGIKFCYTLEDPVRDKKIPGDTAIPAGTYNISYQMSSRFKTKLPTIDNVPGFAGVRIHAGNTTMDTRGCILVGTQRKSNGELLQSRAALESLKMIIAEAAKEGETITLTIR